jgi:hypothetical protein
MTGPTILSIDELCVAARATLEHPDAGIPGTLELPVIKALLGDQARHYRDIKTWVQVPTFESVTGATYPAVAITSPGLVGAPVYQRSSNTWQIVARVGVGVYDRSTKHDETAAKVRNWIAVVRTTLLRNVTLGGVAEGLTWSGEEYDLLPGRQQARTIGAGAVAVDVRANVPDTVMMGLPTVTSTGTTTELNP